MKKISIIFFLAQTMFLGIATAQIEISSPEKNSFGLELGTQHTKGKIGLTLFGFYSYKDIVTLKLSYSKSQYSESGSFPTTIIPGDKIKTWLPEVQVNLLRPKAHNKIGLYLSSNYKIASSKWESRDSKEYKILGNVYTKIRLNDHLELIPTLQAGYGLINNPYLSSKSYFAYGASLMLNWKNGPYIKGGISNAYDFSNEKFNRGFLTIGYSF